MSSATPSTPAAPETPDASQQLIQMQKEWIASLKLNINLIDEKLGMAVQAAETWKSRYEALEKQALDLQSKYLALLNPSVTLSASGPSGQVD